MQKRYFNFGAMLTAEDENTARSSYVDSLVLNDISITAAVNGALSIPPIKVCLPSGVIITEDTTQTLSLTDIPGNNSKNYTYQSHCN